MIGIIITLFGFSNMVQFTLEIPEFLPQPSTVDPLEKVEILARVMITGEKQLNT